MKFKKILKIIIPIVSIIVILIGSCFIYLCTSYKAIDVDKYLVNDDEIIITETSSYYFFDGSGEDKVLIFYGGAKVEEKAYAQLLRLIAKYGIDCYILKMPFHLAFFDPNKADSIISSTSYESYYVGGHSLGGAIASNYASETKNDIKGLVLLASYSTSNLKNKDDFKVISIYGSEDGILNKKKYEDNKINIDSSNFHEICLEGGNHAQFGNYGKQSGDKEAKMEREEQIFCTMQSIVSFIL